jgi:hypothetical protein
MNIKTQLRKWKEESRKQHKTLPNPIPPQAQQQGNKRMVPFFASLEVFGFGHIPHLTC